MQLAGLSLNFRGTRGGGDDDLNLFGRQSPIGFLHVGSKKCCSIMFVSLGKFIIEVNDSVLENQ